MHRDKKIGFALGILLIGIVTAFFFRNEPDPFAELPPLDDPRGLDAQIAEKPIAPYTDPIGAQPGANAPSGPRQNPWQLPEMYRPLPQPPQGGESLSAFPAAPDPINLAEPVPLPVDNPLKSIEVGNPFGDLPRSSSSKSNALLPGNEAWTSVPSSPSDAPPKPELVKSSPPAEATPTMYKIKQGDTLSLLAEKHLGSSRRFMEIYEANRDKLKNPDDIRMGMLIRIPPRVKFKETLPGISSPPVEEKLPILLPSPNEANRFSPSSRSPLSPVRRE